MVKHDYSLAVILSDGNQRIHDQGIKVQILQEISALAAGILSEVLFSGDVVQNCKVNQTSNCSIVTELKRDRRNRREQRTKLRRRLIEDISEGLTNWRKKKNTITVPEDQKI